jgi:hypothetical protein
MNENVMKTNAQNLNEVNANGAGEARAAHRAAGCPGSLSRCGKIGRLPRAVRERLNRSLEEGSGGPEVLKWLSGLPETKAVAQERFGGREITQQNLSEWRRGGYQDWLRH